MIAPSCPRVSAMSHTRARPAPRTCLRRGLPARLRGEWHAADHCHCLWNVPRVVFPTPPMLIRERLEVRGGGASGSG
eukprot:scaffold676_cov115-Isochrysis_galbana.AAC.16